MRLWSYDITGTGTSPVLEFDLNNIRGHSIAWSILYSVTSGSHSTQCQISGDGVNWVNLGAALTAGNVIPRTEKAMFARFVIGGTTPVGRVQVVY